MRIRSDHLEKATQCQPSKSPFLYHFAKKVEQILASNLGQRNSLRISLNVASARNDWLNPGFRCSVCIMFADSLGALLAQSIDYAGMFPPCNLGLEPALRNQAEYVRLPDRWMLGAFVLPVEQFDAAKQLLSQFDPVRPLRVAALGARTENAVTFAEALVKADAEIGSLSRQNVDLVSITHLEM